MKNSNRKNTLGDWLYEEVKDDPRVVAAVEDLVERAQMAFSSTSNAIIDQQVRDTVRELRRCWCLPRHDKEYDDPRDYMRRVVTLMLDELDVKPAAKVINVELRRVFGKGMNYVDLAHAMGKTAATPKAPTSPPSLSGAKLVLQAVLAPDFDEWRLKRTAYVANKAAGVAQPAAVKNYFKKFGLTNMIAPPVEVIAEWPIDRPLSAEFVKVKLKKNVQLRVVSRGH